MLSIRSAAAMTRALDLPLDITLRASCSGACPSYRV